MDTIEAIYSVAQIRQIEAAFEAQCADDSLMQRAGDATAAHIIEWLKAPEKWASSALISLPNSKILVLVGNGNNGGDGIVAAAALQQRGLSVEITFALDATAHKVKAPLAQQHLKAFMANGGTEITLAEAQQEIAKNSYAVIVDAIFGIGVSITIPAKPIEPALYSFIESLNAHRDSAISPHTIAVDVPSGIDAETGAPCLQIAAPASKAIAVIADETLTFIGHKAGLHTGDGLDYAGAVTCFDLSIPSALLPTVAANLLQHVQRPFAHRQQAQHSQHGQHGQHGKRNVHKGTFGTAVIIGGSPGMVGAGWLAARAALLCGAGKTVLAQITNDNAQSVDSQYPEIMHLRLNNPVETPEFRAYSAIGIGVGLGQSEAAIHIFTQVMQQNCPLIIDADALHLLANSPALTSACVARTAATVLTPHPREAAILLACSTADVQQNRIKAALAIAKKYRAIVVLKGAGSITAAASGTVWINQSGNAGMASGGMGDVLTGMLCAAFCGADTSAAEIDATRSVANTVWLHGCAADDCARLGLGPIGMRASEVAEAARRHLNAPTQFSV